MRKISIRNVHTFRKQEKEDGLKTSLNQATARTSTLIDNTKEEKPEQPRTKRIQELDEFEVRRACFVSWVKEIAVEEEYRSCVGLRLTLSARRRACENKCI